MTITFEVGTAGFIGSRRDWLNMPFINCLEINSTFYRLPTNKSLQNFIKLTERGPLVFSVKVSRFVTHMKRLKDCKGAFNKFWKAVLPLGSNLKAILLQLPPSFKFNDENMERLRKMTYLPRTNGAGDKISTIFEFRDKSWFKTEVVRLFKSRGWTLGGTLINKKKGVYWMGNMPAGLHLPTRTSDCTYLRIHGGRGYRGGYGPKELKNIEKKILSERTPKNYIIFNNVFFKSRNKTCKYNRRRIRYAALCNASEFGRMTRKRRR